MRKGQIGVIVFILLILLVVAIILVIIFIKGKDTPKYEPVNQTVNKTYYNITLASNAGSIINYLLSNATQLLVNGTLFPNRIEEYNGGIEANTTVVLEGFSAEYYYNSSVCNVTRNDFPCGVGLKQKSLNYSVWLNQSLLVIDPFNKTIQAPILLCWTEQANVVNVLMYSNGVRLEETKVPDEWKKEVDFCYSVKADLRLKTAYQIEIHRNPFLNETDILKMRILDFEKEGYLPIGMREMAMNV